MTKIAVFLNTILPAIILLGPSFLGFSSNAFSVAPVTLRTSHTTHHRRTSPSSFLSLNTISSRKRTFHQVRKNEQTSLPISTTKLSMYNLPPGGGGGGKDNSIAEIAKGALSLVLIIGFFASPLGGIVLGLFNSLLVLAILLPVLGTVGFQLWEKFNTIKAPCPNCGAPATVLKYKGGDNVVDSAPAPQSLCFSCGAVLEPNADNTGINNVTGRKTINDLNSPQGASIFDFFSNSAPAGDPWSSTTPGTTANTPTPSNKKSKTEGIDKNAVIDVDVLDEDKPFQ